MVALALIYEYNKYYNIHENNGRVLGDGQDYSDYKVKVPFGHSTRLMVRFLQSKASLSYSGTLSVLHGVILGINMLKMFHLRKEMLLRGKQNWLLERCVFTVFVLNLI